jgi:site-specific recombinase XerD
MVATYAQSGGSDGFVLSDDLKTAKSRRRIALGDYQRERLIAACAGRDKGALVLNAKGTRMDGTQLRDRYRDFCARHDFEYLSPYHWRHTFATLSLDGGIDIAKLRDLMGHTTITTTNRYLTAHDTALATASLAHSERISAAIGSAATAQNPQSDKRQNV